jgi:hypothetical protein
MKKISFLFLLIVISILTSYSQKNLAAYWSFDTLRQEVKILKMVRGQTFVPKEQFAYTRESISGRENDLNGKFYKSVAGVKGNSLLLDGYTNYIELSGRRRREEAVINSPRVTGPFTIEAWIAIGAYPENLCAIADNQDDVADGSYNGYFFGLDAMGRLAFRIATKGKYEEIISSKTLPLNTWIHIAAVYSPNDGMTIYMNGSSMGNKKTDDAFSPATAWTSLLIGRSRAKFKPYQVLRPEGTEPSFIFFDGLIDELKIYSASLTTDEISKSYLANKTGATPELPERKFPSGPKSPGMFRAVNATLKYYEAWDAPWLIDKNSDVVVQFDQSDCKFVFWHGTAYIPAWVTENDIWFGNGFNEGWNELNGSCEPMSDKRTKYSNVKIIESNDARVVVQWRYGLVDVAGLFAFEDRGTGWGDWTNETFIIYPDMVGVREVKLLSNAPNAAHENQESMMVLAPGQWPEKVLNYAALSVANIKGDTITLSWEKATPPSLPQYPKNPNIQVVNTKSAYHPFSVIRPQDSARMDIYSGEIRREVSVFPWWNHWPVEQKNNDGRFAQFADRASHSSLSHWSWKPLEITDRAQTKIMLNGLTTKKVSELIPLAKSWSNPPGIVFRNNQSFTASYKPEEKCYNIQMKEGKKEIEFTLNGSENSPVVNPAFVIEGWGNKPAALKINGALVGKGNNFRYGFRQTLNSVDLVVWIRKESTTTVQISLSYID